MSQAAHPGTKTRTVETHVVCHSKNRQIDHQVTSMRVNHHCPSLTPPIPRYSVKRVGVREGTSCRRNVSVEWNKSKWNVNQMLQCNSCNIGIIPGCGHDNRAERRTFLWKQKRCSTYLSNKISFPEYVGIGDVTQRKVAL